MNPFESIFPRYDSCLAKPCLHFTIRRNAGPLPKIRDDILGGAHTADGRFSTHVTDYTRAPSRRYDGSDSGLNCFLVPQAWPITRGSFCGAKECIGSCLQHRPHYLRALLLLSPTPRKAESVPIYQSQSNALSGVTANVVRVQHTVFRGKISHDKMFPLSLLRGKILPAMFGGSKAPRKP